MKLIRIMHRHPCHACGLKFSGMAIVQEFDNGAARFWHPACAERAEQQATRPPAPHAAQQEERE